jgi:hypothetical protein
VTLTAYLPNNTHSYGMKTNTWKYLQVKGTKLLVLYTMSMPKSYRFRAYTWGKPELLRRTWFMMATSEIRCRDRGGLTPQHKGTKYIYSNTNPNLIPFSTLILGTKVPQWLFFIIFITNFQLPGDYWYQYCIWPFPYSWWLCLLPHSLCSQLW